MKSIYYLIFVISTIMTFTSCNKVSRADSLRLDNKFEEAAKLYQEAADEGDAYAKWRLAYAYYNADGVDLDFDKAKKLLEEAAKAGCEEAKCDIACSYMYGWNNYDKDVEKGKKLFMALVEKSTNDYVIARYARELLHGWTFEQDKEKAEKLLESVNNKDNDAYLRAMGELFEVGGDKTEINYKRSLEYYMKAFAQGNRHSAWEVAEFYLGNDEIEEDTEAQIEWLKKGVESNNTYCMLWLAKIFISEDTTLTKYHNINKGLDLIKKATKHGAGNAYTTLGHIYWEGELVGKDDEKAYDYYKKAYELKDKDGSFQYAFKYINGIGGEKDVKKGVEIWEKAVEYGSEAAANNLFCYYYGVAWGAKLKELDKARQYLLEGAKLNDDMACNNLAKHYYKGTDLFEKNVSQAFIYFKKSADLGNVDACSSVSYMYANGIGCQKNPQKAKEYEDKTKAKEDKKEN